jgi:LmbE family N-acetylglucosaminyl deacetylase
MGTMAETTPRARTTLVSFHAHPDDECIVTGGTIARAAHEGHRVVLVFATRGEVGEVPDGFLAPGETLADRREAEARRAAEILGAAQVEFLGYRDSGMADTDTVGDASSFWSADVDVAATRLAAIVAREQPAVLTTYDERGNYGHPDHIQVHRVAMRARELEQPARLYAATVDREFIHELRRFALEALPDADDVPDPDEIELGIASERITTRVDVTGFLAGKRAAMRAHASQIDERSVFSALPDDAFRRAFGTEWFLRLDETPAAPETWLFPDDQG